MIFFTCSVNYRDKLNFLISPHELNVRCGGEENVINFDLEKLAVSVRRNENPSITCGDFFFCWPLIHALIEAFWFLIVVMMMMMMRSRKEEASCTCEVIFFHSPSKRTPWIKIRHDFHTHPAINFLFVSNLICAMFIIMPGSSLHQGNC